MNMLRATVRHKAERWEVKLLDLRIVADGDSESSMLRDLEYALTAEYHLALKHQQTPFVNIFLAAPSEVSKSWEDGGKNLRSLSLPPEVSQALAAVFRAPNLSPFTIESCAAA